MGVLDQITRTHIDLDMELARIQRLLEKARTEESTESPLPGLVSRVEHVRRRLDAHIERANELGVRSDFVLGEGALEEAQISTYHAPLREALIALGEFEGLDDAADIAAFARRFERFIELFDVYTRNETQFLSTNSSVLYPGGTTS